MEKHRAVTICGVILVAGALAASLAWADSLEELAEEVERTSAQYNAAVEQQERIAEEIDTLNSRIAELEGQMPALEEQAGAAAVKMYKSDGELGEILELFLESNSLEEAIQTYEAYNAILEYRANQIGELKRAKQELETSRTKLDDEKAKADEAVSVAKDALDEATAARTAAQEAAAAKEAAEKASASSSALASDIDWTMPKDKFISHWGDRIDAYLSGTPLSGYGKEFAEASYKYGTDPRWSPAISRIESGCGAVCFASHNAWGWMGHSFGSWEEAIPLHVEYLAGPLYGGYITMAGASTYCPPGGPWYDAVSAEMRKI